MHAFVTTEEHTAVKAELVRALPAPRPCVYSTQSAHTAADQTIKSERLIELADEYSAQHAELNALKAELAEKEDEISEMANVMADQFDEMCGMDQTIEFLVEENNELSDEIDDCALDLAEAANASQTEAAKYSELEDDLDDAMEVRLACPACSSPAHRFGTP